MLEEKRGFYISLKTFTCPPSLLPPLQKISTLRSKISYTLFAIGEYCKYRYVRDRLCANFRLRIINCQNLVPVKFRSLEEKTELMRSEINGIKI